MSDSTGHSRRDFLKSSSAVAAGTALAGSLSVTRSAHAAGAEEIKVALIGGGGRGCGAIGNLMKAAEITGDNVKLVAIADAFENRCQVALKVAEKFGSRTDVPPERVFTGLDAYQKAIDCGVDMVILATPPGFRPMQYAAAVKAGANVFMEKPCCVDGAGFRSLMKTNKLVEEKGLKVGVGLQRHHQAGYLAGVKAIKDGKLGDLMFLRCYWNGGDIWMRNRKPGMTEMEYQVYNWYHFCWLSGDNICEQHVHNLDACNWVMDDHPIEANGMGGCQARNEPELSQIFDHHCVEFTYRNGVKMFSQCRQQDGKTFHSVSEHAHGTKGSSAISGSRRDAPQLASGNPYEQEHVDLLNAIRKNEKYHEGWNGATSTMTAVLGRMATYSGQVVKWDDAVAKGPSLMAEKLTWDAEAPVVKGPDGKYPIPVPGQYKPY
jgi:myo-inositol 2-dehydrogenase/D-chiro-inositol 1-dehydrogenase